MRTNDRPHMTATTGFIIGILIAWFITDVFWRIKYNAAIQDHVNTLDDHKKWMARMSDGMQKELGK